MNEFHLITWKQFENRKLLDKSEIVKTESIEDALDRIRSMNAQKRLTTADYRNYNLSKLLEDSSLTIKENVKTE